MVLRMFGVSNEPAELWFNSSESVAPSPEPCASGFPYITPCNIHRLCSGCGEMSKWTEGCRGKPWYPAGSSRAVIALIYGTITVHSVVCRILHIDPAVENQVPFLISGCKSLKGGASCPELGSECPNLSPGMIRPNLARLSHP